MVSMNIEHVTSIIIFIIIWVNNIYVLSWKLSSLDISILHLQVRHTQLCHPVPTKLYNLKNTAMYLTCCTH